MVFGNNHAYQRGQEDQSKILTDHFLYFLSIGVVVVPKGRSKRHVPSTPCQCADTVDSFASWPFSRFSPSSHSTARYDPGKALRDPYAQKERWHLPQCDRTLDVVNDEHCDRNSLVSVATDHGAAHGAQSAQDGPTTTQ